MAKDYSIGYGKPPTKHQFKKGKSGNRRGRRGKPRFTPKEPLDAERVLIAELQSLIMIGGGGKKEKISKLEALYKLLIGLALKGDRSAIKAVVALIEKLPKDAFKNEAHRKRMEAVDQLLEKFGPYEITSEDDSALGHNTGSRSPSSAVADQNNYSSAVNGHEGQGSRARNNGCR